MNIGVISNRYIRVSEPLAYYGNRDTGVKCLCCKGVTKLVKRERLADFSIFQHTMEYTLQLVVRQHIAIERRYHIRTANSFLAVDGVQVFQSGNRLCVQRNNAVAAFLFICFRFSRFSL